MPGTSLFDVKLKEEVPISYGRSFGFYSEVIILLPSFFLTGVNSIRELNFLGLGII